MSNKITKTELDDIQSGKQDAREYSNDEISVFWMPDRCIHSANCLIGLPLVFNNARRPWIDIKGATSQEIMKTVDTCPSRALMYLRKSGKRTNNTKKSGNKPPKFARIHVLKDGPILVSGHFVIRDSKKKKIKTDAETIALCRCGVSKIKPFCDGTHHAAKFHAE